MTLILGIGIGAALVFFFLSPKKEVSEMYVMVEPISDPQTVEQVVENWRYIVENGRPYGERIELNDELIHALHLYHEELVSLEDQPCFTCPKCGIVSYNVNDIENRYCGACHVFS